MTFILLRTTLATLIAFAGGAIGVGLEKVTARHLPVLVYAAMGVLLAVTVCDVLPDAKSLLSWPAFLLATGSGALLFWLVGKYIYHICPSCAIGAFDAPAMQRLNSSALLLMVALGLHSTMDGVAVVIGDRIAGHPNLAILFAVSFHKLPEGLALALLLIGAGYTRGAAFLWTIAIESTTELGGLLGLFALRGLSLPHLGLLFGHVGGGFLYLVVSTLGSARRQIVQPWRSAGTGRPLVVSASAAFALTAVLMRAFEAAR